MRAHLEDVVAFVQVAKDGSFSSAARALGAPKSSVSRRVQKLERTLGTQLLQRTTRSLSLTDAGRGYYERVRHALEEIEGAERLLEGLLDEPRGVLKISIPIDLIGPVARLVEHYLDRFQEVAVVTHVSNARTDLVREGFDLALRAGLLDDSTLIARKLADSPLVLAAAPSYLERYGTPKTLEALRQHRCVIFGSQGVDSTWQLNGPRGPEHVRVSGVVAANDMGFLLKAMLSGRGIGNVPKQVLGRALERGELLRVLPEYSGALPALHAVYPSARHLSPKVRHFIELCVEHAHEMFD